MQFRKSTSWCGECSVLRQTVMLFPRFDRTTCFLLVFNLFVFSTCFLLVLLIGLCDGKKQKGRSKTSQLRSMETKSGKRECKVDRKIVETKTRSLQSLSEPTVMRRCSGAFIHPQVAIISTHCSSSPYSQHAADASRFFVKYGTLNPGEEAGDISEASEILIHPQS